MMVSITGGSSAEIVVRKAKRLPAIIPKFPRCENESTMVQFILEEADSLRSNMKNEI